MNTKEIKEMLQARNPVMNAKRFTIGQQGLDTIIEYAYQKGREAGVEDERKDKSLMEQLFGKNFGG